MSEIVFSTAFSGIGAPEVAWAPLGWSPLWVSEIEPFPAAVLAQRVGVPNLGDARGIAAKLRAGEVDAPDVFIGGSPCQAFSVAGLRQSLADDRGNLTITFVGICDAIDDVRRMAGRRPSIVCWENVPGVLSVKDNAFGCFLAALVGEDEPLVPDGGKWSDAGLVVGPARRAAWRVIDAQGFVPQRRRRVFVVATALDGFDPSAVLHEDEADFEFGVADGWSGWALLPLSARLRRDPAAGGEAREGLTHAVAPSLTASGRGVDLPGDSRGQDPVVAVAAYGGNNTSGPIDVATACRAKGGSGHGDFESETFIATVAGTLGAGGTQAKSAGTATSQDAAAGLLVACATGSVTHTLKADGFDASEDGTGRGQPIINAAWPQTVADPITAHEQRTYTHEGSNFRTRNVVPGEPVAFAENQRDEVRQMSVAGALAAEPGVKQQTYVAFQSSQSGVRVADTHATLDANNGSRRHNGVVAPTITSTNDPSRSPQSSEITAQVAAVSSAVSAVRRLTPTECARLQGFPDDWCDILFRGKPAADGPKYKAFGNSMAVPVITWIGERIAAELGRADV